MAADFLCNVEGCDKPAKTRGWCHMHYRRWHKHGDPLERKSLANGEAWQYLKDVIFAFEGDDCLPWPFSKDRNGYGQISTVENGKRRPIGVHRVICKMAHGQPPMPDLDAAHSCGNGHLACCNKRHLSWKTRRENMADAVAHGTMRPRNRTHKANAKLTEEDVRNIRSLSGVSQTAIADAYGVSQAAISSVLLRKTWLLLE